MSEEVPDTREHQSEAPDAPEAPQAPPRRKRRWKWLAIALGAIIVVPGALFAIWSWISLTYTYSRGDRAGYVQKFSERGWICKTWEGELSMVNIPGAAQERWYFSVRNDSIAQVILNHMGSRVSLTYDEHRGVPTSCFGETPYFVSGVRRVE
jgi:hypothetical protein